MKKIFMVIMIFFLFATSVYAHTYLFRNSHGDWLTYTSSDNNLCRFFPSSICTQTNKILHPMSKGEYVNQLKSISVIINNGVYTFTVNNVNLITFDCKGKNPNDCKMIQDMAEQIKYAKENKIDKINYEVSK